MSYADRLGSSGEMKKYEYSILRYIHDHSCGEYVNIGIVAHHKESKILQYKLNKRYGRISKFFNNFEGKKYKKKVESLENYLKDATKKSKKDFFYDNHDSMGQFIEEFFSNPRSSFKFSEIRSGIDKKPRRRVKNLYEELVLFHESSKSRDRVDERDLDKLIRTKLFSQLASQSVKRNYPVSTSTLTHEFSAAWQNGTLQLLEPVSFDLLHSASIQKKATQWRGTLDALSQDVDFQFSALVAPPPSENQNGVLDAYEDAIDIMEDSSAVRKIVNREKFSDFISEVSEEM